MKNTVAILGCGWLGFPLAKHLLTKGFNVKGSTTSKENLTIFKTSNIAPYLIDLEYINDTVLSFLKANILIISIPSKNTEGFKKLVSFIEKSSVKKVLFISSTSVYPSTNSLVTEQHKVLNSPLVCIENLFTTNLHFKTTIIRFAGLFGYDRKPGNFFKNGRAIPNPNGFVNMIHQDDCVQIISEIIEKNCWNIIFNACADTHPTRREFYTKATIAIHQKKPEFIESTLTEYKIISSEKLKKTLNYTFKYADLMRLDYSKI